MPRGAELHTRLVEWAEREPRAPLVGWAEREPRAPLVECREALAEWCIETW